MVSIPSGINIPGADKATIDIASKLRALPNASCGFGSKGVYIVVIAKPKNTLLPLYVPVSGATVEGRVLSVGLVEIKKLTAFANLDGITSACVPILPTVWYEFRAKQYNVDFGNGISQFSNWKSVADVVVFEGKIEVPCPPFTPPIAVVNFDKLTSSPAVFTQALNVTFSGYGTIPMSGTYKVKVNGTLIGFGSVVNGKVDFAYPGIVSNLLSKFPSLKSPARVDLIINMGNCTFTNSTTISLPSIPLPCTGRFVADVPNIPSLLSGITSPLTTLPIPVRLTESTRSITSIPVRILVDEREVDRRTTGFSGFDAVRTLQTAGADIGISHTVTIESLATDCTIPPLTVNIPSLKPTGIITPLCPQFITTIDSVSHPFEITDFNATFYVYLRGIKEICKSDPTNPAFISKLPKGTMGTITLGNLSSNFYLTDDGIVDIDLSKLINLPSLAGVAVVVTPVIVPEIVIPVDTECSTKSGKIGSPGVYLVSLAEVQAYLNKCHPGGIAETVTGTWAGAFKITRSTGAKYPAGTYFWTTTWEDIRRLY